MLLIFFKNHDISKIFMNFKKVNVLEKVKSKLENEKNDRRK